MADLKQLVKEHAGVEVSLSGGSGRSYDSAIIVHNNGIGDLAGAQRAVLWSLGRYKKLNWEIIEQEQQMHNGRVIDVMTIEMRRMVDGMVSTGMQQVFFDISEYAGE